MLLDRVLASDQPSELSRLAGRRLVRDWLSKLVLGMLGLLSVIALVLGILSDTQTQNNASMRCFVFSRLHLCSCQGSARLQIKSLIAQ